jgi:hypothetical protein
VIDLIDLLNPIMFCKFDAIENADLFPGMYLDVMKKLWLRRILV